MANPGDADHDLLRHLVVELVDELNRVHHRLARLARLAEAALSACDAAAVPSVTRRALEAVYVVAEEYGRASDTVRRRLARGEDETQHPRQ